MRTCYCILLKTLAYVRDIDALTLYFDFQCFTSPCLVGDENQFWAKITKPPLAEITKPQPGYGFYEECALASALTLEPHICFYVLVCLSY